MKKILQINKSILEANDLLGQKIKMRLKKHHIFSLNIMASPGAGKTSLILQTIERLKQSYRIAVIEGDIVPIDVDKIKKLHIPVVLAHTGGACHLDSVMMEKALDNLPLDTIDLLIVENVGNLICPASFYLGTDKNIVIASVPEGDDKPAKYPTMFQGADVVILNKIDYLEQEDFDLKKFSDTISLISKHTEIIPVSCKKGEGVNRWITWLLKEIEGNE